MVVLEMVVRSAVKGVAAAPGTHLHFAARRARKASLGVVGHHTELLQAFHWRGNHRARSGRKIRAAVLPAARSAVCGVTAVHEKGILVAAGTGHLTASVVAFAGCHRRARGVKPGGDRKSTRLNSSH